MRGADHAEAVLTVFPGEPDWGLARLAVRAKFRAARAAVAVWEPAPCPDDYVIGSDL